ncbi:MAG: TRAP transporter small permease [Alphaproteobacteria bacterium]|nr:TRAP transporter small permease [Alphaproteobacteria bacterium]
MRSGELAAPDAAAPLPSRGAGLLAARLTLATRWICGFSAAVALLLPLPILYEIVMDQLQQPPVWVFETTGYAIIMIAFAASGYGLSTGHHFRVSLISEKFPTLAKPLNLLSGLLETAFGALLLASGSLQAYSAYIQDLRSDTLLQVPQFWPELAFPVGGLTILLQGIAHIIAPRRAAAL